MKKFLFGASLAIVLVAALAATAFAVDITGLPDTVEPGQTVQITVTGSESGTSGKISTSGLSISNVSGDFSTPQDFVVVEPVGGLSVVYTCTVTAPAGDTVSFSVSDVVLSNGDRDATGEAASVSAAVESAAEPTQEPTSVPTDEPTTQPSVQPSAAPGGQTTASAAPSGSVKPASGAAATAKPAAGSGKDKLPKTADASMDLWTLAAAAGACAGIAVIAGRKAFSK